MTKKNRRCTANWPILSEADCIGCPCFIPKTAMETRLHTALMRKEKREDLIKEKGIKPIEDAALKKHLAKIEGYERVDVTTVTEVPDLSDEAIEKFQKSLNDEAVKVLVELFGQSVEE